MVQQFWKIIWQYPKKITHTYQTIQSSHHLGLTKAEWKQVSTPRLVHKCWQHLHLEKPKAGNNPDVYQSANGLADTGWYSPVKQERSLDPDNLDESQNTLAEWKMPDRGRVHALWIHFYKIRRQKTWTGQPLTESRSVVAFGSWWTQAAGVLEGMNMVVGF